MAQRGSTKAIAALTVQGKAADLMVTRLIGDCTIRWHLGAGYGDWSYHASRLQERPEGPSVKMPG